MKMHLLLRLLAIFLVPVALFVKRDRKLWVFGNKKGFCDNSRYFMDYAESRGQVRCLWIASSEAALEMAKVSGHEAYLKYSLEGMWFSLRSGVQFMSNGLGDLNRPLALGSFVVSFWHGTPIKRIYLDSKYDMSRLGSNAASMAVARKLLAFQNNFLLHYYASNSLEETIVSKAAGIPLSKVSCLGSPRFDVIRRRKLDASSRKRNVPRYILYAPTWREDGWSPDFVIKPEALLKLEEVLARHDAVLMVKPHPLTAMDEVTRWGIFSSNRIRLAADLGFNDINEAYAVVDLLITDVSSAIFDFLVVGDKYLFFMPDVDEYVEGDRGLYEYYQEILGGNCIKNWMDLAVAVDRTLEGSQDFDVESLRKIAKENQNKTDVCAAIYDDITKRINGEVKGVET